MNALGFELVEIPSNINIHLLSSEFPATEIEALTAVLKSDDRKIRLEEEIEELSIRLSEQGGDDEELADLIEECANELEGLASSDEASAAMILNGLGFDKKMQSMKTKEFSGGWRMRIALACALFKQPTLLLLDEPTNHLDMEAVIWLEN